MKEIPTRVPLRLPESASSPERKAFNRLVSYLAALDPAVTDSGLDHDSCAQAANLGRLHSQPYLSAAAHVLMDLVDQGWGVQGCRNGALLSPPTQGANPSLEKDRVRRQEHVRREEQLRKPSVRRFIAYMERAHQHGPELVSVFNLMRDGRELADSLGCSGDPDKVIQPYVQIVDGSTCEITGFRLHDIWRYFRHTWANSYATVPGRSMPILVRDAATKHHAIIGLAAISSPVVQIAERDAWIGWETGLFFEEIENEPTDKVAAWIVERIKSHIDEIYISDLVEDQLLPPRGVSRSTAETVELLRVDAKRYHEKHHRASNVRVARGNGDTWIERAESYLFRSKRSAALAEAMEIAAHLGAFFEREATPLVGLQKALQDTKARAQLRRVIRRARGERVGTVIADLTVCGAVAPYNALAAGKLVSALAVSPTVLSAYRKKYSRPSEIASAMAGRPIERESRLAFVGTTSLYGSGSSQYNRLFWPESVMGGANEAKMGFFRLGRSRAYGTSHFSEETVNALVRVSQLSGATVRVNSIFGEGVSPRLRKVRLGLSALGWPSNELLKHGRERIVYGAPLVSNLRDYSLGIDRDPDYLVDLSLVDGDGRISAWWLERWAMNRAKQPAVQTTMRANSLVRPICHGARVRMPSDDEPLMDWNEPISLGA